MKNPAPGGLAGAGQKVKVEFDCSNLIPLKAFWQIRPHYASRHRPETDSPEAAWARYRRATLRAFDNPSAAARAVRAVTAFNFRRAFLGVAA